MTKHKQKIRVTRRSVGAHPGFAVRTGGPARRSGPRQPFVRRCRALLLPRGHHPTLFAGAVWGFPGGAPAPQSLEPERDLVAPLRCSGARCRQRVRHDRLDHRTSPPPAQRWCKRGAASHRMQPRWVEHQDPRHCRCTGQLHGISSHAGPSARPRRGRRADVILADTEPQKAIASRSYDAQARVIEPLLSQGKGVVIPSVAPGRWLGTMTAISTRPAT